MELVETVAAGWWRLAAPLAPAPFAVAFVAAALDRALARRASPGLRALAWWAVPAKLAVPVALAAPAVPLAAVTAAGDGAAAPAWLVPAFAVWLAGALASATLAVRRSRALRRAWLATAAPADAAVLRIAHAAARRVGLRRLPRVAVGPDVPGPAVLGFVRPVVVLPASLAARAVDADGRRALGLVLLHELAHVARRDGVANLATLAVQVVFWFHPLAWWSRRRLAALAELATDRAVVRALGARSVAYRSALLAHAPLDARTGFRETGLAGAGLGLGLGGARSALVARLEALRAPPRTDGPLARAAVLATAVGLVATLGRPLAGPAAQQASLDGVHALAAVPLDATRGCLELRHAVQARMALAAAERR